MPASDVIDSAAGLVPGDALHEARRYRGKVVEATEASHDALLDQPVEGLSTAERLRVAERVCTLAGATRLAAHYAGWLGALDAAAPSTALSTMLEFAAALTVDPRQGDRAAIRKLEAAGLGDAAIVALAQLIAFLAYQLRVVSGLAALKATPPAAGAGAALAALAALAASAATEGGASSETATAVATPIRRNGFTDESLDWQSWLVPVDVAEATPLQLAVLDESHAQSRSSPYYLTLVHQPSMLRHRSAAYNAIMYAPGGLPRAERELGAMVVSVTNGCVYCTSVHAQRFEQLARRSDTVVQVFDDPRTAGSTERERAVARFAIAVTERPQALGADDIAPLRAVGMSDLDVIDLLHAVAIFGWANRLMQNLGEPGPAVAKA